MDHYSDFSSIDLSPMSLYKDKGKLFKKMCFSKIIVTLEIYLISGVTIFYLATFAKLHFRTNQFVNLIFSDDWLISLFIFLFLMQLGFIIVVWISTNMCWKQKIIFEKENILFEKNSLVTNSYICHISMNKLTSIVMIHTFYYMIYYHGDNPNKPEIIQLILFNKEDRRHFLNFLEKNARKINFYFKGPFVLVMQPISLEKLKNISKL